MKFLALIIFYLFTNLTFASELLSESTLSQINLDGLRILNDQNKDVLASRFKKITRPSHELTSFIERTIHTLPISQVWMLENKNSFYNRLLFIAPSIHKNIFELYLISLNPYGSTVIKTFEIVAASPRSLDLVEGPQELLVYYKAIGSGILFY